MNHYSLNHHVKAKWIRKLITGTVVIGLVGCALTAGSSRSYATIQGKSNSTYRNTYFVMGNPAVVTIMVTGISIGIGLGIPLTVKLYSNVISRTK